MSQDDIRILIDYYRQQGVPGDQQMLIALLKEVQAAEGGILTKSALQEITVAYDLKESILLALVRRIPALKYEDIPHKLEICATCKCSGDLRSYIEETLGVKNGTANKEAGFAYRTVNCMKNCKNGPSVRWDGVLYSRVTIDLLKKLMR